MPQYNLQFAVCIIDHRPYICYIIVCLSIRLERCNLEKLYLDLVMCKVNLVTTTQTTSEHLIFYAGPNWLLKGPSGKTLKEPWNSI